MAQSIIADFFKSAIMLINIEVILFKKIVGYVYIIPSIVVQVANCYSETKTYFTAINMCLLAHISKMPVIISVKALTSFKIAYIAQVAVIAKTLNRPVTVIQDKAIQIAVMII